MKRRVFALVAAVGFLLCGCGDAADVSDPISDVSTVIEGEESGSLERLSLAYSHDDTLNPFAVTTAVNAQLTGLLYDSLTVLDSNFVPQFSLASSVTFADATHLVAVLRQGAVFSDGSAVTAADIITSFQEAKKSARYSALLSNVTSAKEEQGQITFTLSSADPNAIACLSFPVVRASDLTTEAAKAPLGGGLYCLRDIEGGAELVMNPYHATKPHYATVALQHLPGNTARYYGLATGDITYYYSDLSDGDLPRVAGANRAVSMNAMVYLGINSSRAALSDPTVRQAVSALLDRAAVCRTAYADWATASAQPFHPGWQGVAGLTTTAVRDLDGALTLLEGAGYTPKNGKRMTLELIYSTQRSDRARVADLVRTQMEDGGVAITPVPLSEEEYLARLKSGQYDLYVGEIHLTADMSLRPLLMGGNASYGVSRSGVAAVAYGQYLSGEGTIEAFLSAFAADLPYIPVCWRSGVAAFDRRLTVVTPTGYDPYAGFAEWQ